MIDIAVRTNIGAQLLVLRVGFDDPKIINKSSSGRLPTRVLCGVLRCAPALGCSCLYSSESGSISNSRCSNMDAKRGSLSRSPGRARLACRRGAPEHLFVAGADLCGLLASAHDGLEVPSLNPQHLISPGLRRAMQDTAHAAHSAHCSLLGVWHCEAAARS